jgi:hypothetical protein
MPVQGSEENEPSLAKPIFKPVRAVPIRAFFLAASS